MDKNFKNLLGLLFLSAALFGFWAFVVVGFKQVQSAKDGLQQYEELVQRRRAALAQVDALYTEAQQRIPDPARIAAVIPTKKQEAELTSAFEKIALGTGMQIALLGFEAEKASGEGASVRGQQSLAIDFSGSGSYESVVRFLESLEKNIRVIDIHQLAITPKENEGGPTTYDVNIKGNAYFFSL